MGIPSVTIATEPFIKAAKAVCRSQGLPDIPIVVIPHDYLTETQDDMRAKIAHVVDQILRGLFGSDAV